MAWIRTLCCVCCGSILFVQAAHVGDHGAFRKCSDLETIPLCATHHLWEGAKDSYHRLGRQFWPYWRLDRNQIIAELQDKYASEFPDEAKQWRIAA